MSTRTSSTFVLALLVLLPRADVPQTAPRQPAASAPAALPATVLREDHQVIQRDGKDRGHFRVSVIDATATDTYRVRITGPKTAKVQDRVVKAVAGEAGGQEVPVTDVPVGGPYKVEIIASGGSGSGGAALTFDDVLVGDIWVTGGQSNMYGAAIPREDLPAIPGINVFDNKHFEREAHWAPGKAPIHRNARDKQYGGRIGPAYFFARQLFRESGVPIGFIPCAQGGALAIWDPGQRAKNRYGFMEHHIRTSGGRIRGMIWYQGEQDAIFGDEHETVMKPSLIYPLSTYVDRYAELVAAMRDEFGGPDMPVILAQINGHYHPPYYSVAGYEAVQAEGKDTRGASMPGGVGWEKIREAQRQIAARIPNVRLVSTLDLTLFDSLHLDYESARAVGERMATLALPFVKTGVPARPGLDLESARWAADGLSVVVRFKGVTGRLTSAGRPIGFTLRSAHRTTGEGEDWVFRADLMPDRPDTITLLVNKGAPRDAKLYYGAGPAAVGNLVDERGLAVPAFGPVTIESVP